MSSVAELDEALRHVSILDERAEWLDGRQRNDTSQFGEDGLIEAVFDRIGTKSEWCFEVGAADGLFFSNTKRLRDAGWRAVLIESDNQQHGKLLDHASARVQVVHATISERNKLDDILAGCAAPLLLDLGVIDIDGQDYWAWSDLQMFRPRVVLIEFAYFNDPLHVPARNSGITHDQAGLQAIINLGAEKGYTAVAKTYCNVLFVDSQVFDAC